MKKQSKKRAGNYVIPSVQHLSDHDEFENDAPKATIEVTVKNHDKEVSHTSGEGMTAENLSVEEDTELDLAIKQLESSRQERYKSK